MSTSSTNIFQQGLGVRGWGLVVTPLRPKPQPYASLHGQDADDAPTGAVVLEPDAPRNFRVDRVVFAEPGVSSRKEPAAPLPHDDRASRHQIAIVRLHAEPLRV